MPMKFKKEIVTLLLASALLTTSLTACQKTPDGGDKIDNTTPKITTGETTLETKPTDTSNPNEVIRDVPELGKLKLVPYSDMQAASIWRAEEGEFFLYISEWDAYRQLSGLSSYHNWFYFTDNCIVIDDKTTTITLIDQVGKHDEPTIITYHFNRDNALVELHAVPLDIIASSEYDTFFVNMHTADHGYYFLTPSIDGNQDGHMDGVQGWPLFIFETTDGGKSWNQILTNTFDFCTSDHINIVKFISPDIGIISFRYVNLEDLCERTYLTLDGGLTWNPISQLPYPPDKKWGYSEVVDLALIDGFYYLTVKISDNNQEELQFCSKDLTNWTLLPYSENDLNSNQNDPYAFYKYEEEAGGKVYLQIDAWNQMLTLPFAYENDIEKFWILYDAKIVGDKGFFVYHPDNDGTSIKILSFIKGSDEITEQTITWDEAICQNQIFCDFIDDENGYIFVTEEIDAPGFSRGAEKVAHLYKTQDGGKTWASVNCDNIPYISMRESLILAKFVTEDIAIIAGRIWATDCNLHERTYITQDGGLTWNPILLPYPLNGEWDYSEVVDMVLIDDCYYLTVKSSGNNRKEMQFWSKNLTNWMLVPNSENGLGPNQSISSVLYENDGKVYLQIGAWNQTLEFPFTYTEIKDLEFANATAIFGDKGIFVYHPDGLGTSIKILSFAEGSDEITEQTITWDEPIYENQIFCNFINDEIGYIFVIEEGGHPGFASGAEKISKLYKTQDGGKTWTSIDCSNAPYTNLKECIILAKFATEDIGIIAGRHWANDYSFQKRTYITKDGGLTWIPVDLSDFFERNPDKDYGIQACDLQYIDSTYYLYVQAVHEETGKPRYVFTSSDGIEWNYLKQVN